MDYCPTKWVQVAQVGTWYRIYAKNMYTTMHTCPRGVEKVCRRNWKKTVEDRGNGKIILEIPIDICYTDTVPDLTGTDETLPAPRGSVSADKFVRKVSNWKTIPSIS